MRNRLILSFVFFFIGFVLTAQEYSRIKNHETGLYLNTENGILQASSINEGWKSAVWEFLRMESGHYRIRNLNDGTFLNIETEAPQSTVIEHHWWSPMWAIKNVDGTDKIKIQSRWKDDRYLNMQNGLKCSAIPAESSSAIWEKEIVNTSQFEISNLGAGLFNKQKALDAHNKLRAEVGVTPLEWSEDLAFKAQLWADKMAALNDGHDFVMEHSGPGENLAGGFVNGDPPETRILLGWGESEKPNFNPATRKCYEGKICGHYTQIVWRKSQKVGCGVGVNANGKYILVCNYDPGGNKNREPAF